MTNANTPIPFGWRTQIEFLTKLGAQTTLRRTQSNGPEGNLILDCHFGPIADPAALAAQLSHRAGVVEHGLFLGLASEVIVAHADGIRHLYRPEATPTTEQRRPSNHPPG